MDRASRDDFRCENFIFHSSEITVAAQKVEQHRDKGYLGDFGGKAIGFPVPRSSFEHSAAIEIHSTESIIKRGKLSAQFNARKAAQLTIGDLWADYLFGE